MVETGFNLLSLAGFLVMGLTLALSRTGWSGTDGSNPVPSSGESDKLQT
jgi:hypothetical protein